MKKRGMIELQFNWIFILIAGAVILFFFLTIVEKQREFSELKTSGTIVTNLQSILTGAQISTGTVNIVEMPKVDINFECDRYSIGPIPKQTKGNVIFSPNLLKGKQMITWAVDWNLPYRVTNFLYITDPQLRYVIVGNGPAALNLIEDLPDEMNVEHILTPTAVIDKNNYKVKFIFLGAIDDNVVLTNLEHMPDEDVTAISLSLSSDVIPNTGTIKFWQKKEGPEWEEKEETKYLKHEALYGAIFAEDIEMYNCVMRKAFKKLNLVTAVYLNRSSELRDYYISNTKCSNTHGKAVNAGLIPMLSASADNMVDFPSSAIPSMGSMWDYAKNIGILQGSANNLAQLYSCILVY